MFIVIFRDLRLTPGHLFLSDSRQWFPRKFESVHNGLKSLESERGAVVVHFYYPEGKAKTCLRFHCLKVDIFTPRLNINRTQKQKYLCFKPVRFDPF